MAKLSPKGKRNGPARQINITAWIERSADTQGLARKYLLGGEGFKACVLLKGNMEYCALAKNPRLALGKAMAGAGADIMQRRGTFKGLRRKTRKRRRR